MGEGITNEQLKYCCGEKLLRYLAKLFNDILETQEIPSEWKYSDIILIYKKGDKHNIENYRPISSSPTISKVFTKLIGKRITNILMEQLPIEQAGFRKGFSTTDHLFTLNLLIEKASEFQYDLHLAFIDFKKSFRFHGPRFYDTGIDTARGPSTDH